MRARARVCARACVCVCVSVCVGMHAYRRIPLASPGIIHAHFGDLVGLYTGRAYTRVGLYNNGGDYFLDLRRKRNRSRKNTANKSLNTGKTHENVRREQRVGKFQSESGQKMSIARI